MDPSNNNAGAGAANNTSFSKVPPPPVPPSRRSVIMSKPAMAPSPPPKPSSLSSPMPPRKPISLAAAPLATVTANSSSSTAPIPAPRPQAHNTGYNSQGQAVPSSVSPPFSSFSTGVASSAITSPSSIAAAAAAAAATFNHPNNNHNTNQHQGFISAPASSNNSPATSHVASFASLTIGSAVAPQGTGSAANSPATTHLHPHHRSQSIPATPSHLRPSASNSFLPASTASTSIAAKQQLLQQQQHGFGPTNEEMEDGDDDESAANPFSDPSNIAATEPTPASAPNPTTSPSFMPRTYNQPSLLTARLQAIPATPSLHAPVPQYGSQAHSANFSRPSAVSPPPPPPLPSSSIPTFPQRSRSPLAGVPSPVQQTNNATPTPARQTGFVASQRHSSVQPLPPPFPTGQSPATSSPSQAVPPPPRRASIQLATPSTAQHHQPRGSSPLLASPGESGNSARFRNPTAPQQAYEYHSTQTPKRVFSSSSSNAPSTMTASYTNSTSPVPERGFANMDLSDSQSDSDETSDDSDKDYEDAEEYHPSTIINPFMNNTDAMPRPTRSRTMMDSPAPPCLPARPAIKSPPARQPNVLPDQDIAPALPPKPAVRRRPQLPQDAGSLLSLGQAMDDSESSRNTYQLAQTVGSGPSAIDGVFPDYSRSNRRLPQFSGVAEVQDIHQKSHGVRAFSVSNEQVATATSNIRIYSLFTGINISSYGHEKDNKPTALLFAQSRRPDSLGQYLWAGWSEGSLQVIDTRTMEVVEKKRANHKGGCVIHIIRCKTQVWTVDDTGSVFIWSEDTMLGRPTIQTPLQSLAIPPKQICAIAVQDMLWSSDGTKIHVVRVGPDAGRPKMQPTSMDIPFGIGPLTCLATIAGSGQVFSGHEDGKVILWSIETREKIRIINVHAYRIMSLLGVGSYLWAGFTTGKIYVLDLRPDVPVVMKDWQAHKDSGVAMLQLDEEGLILGSRHQVGSCAENGEIKIWDGLMAKDRLTKGMVDRSKEYCQWRDLKILICSWNIDASKPTAQDANGGADRRMFESWLTSMDQDGPPDIISVGFQEIVDLESKKMTA
ncbi:hypothetical protein BGZ51_005757, partial [Haplosporangium sp. Z 767]